MRRILRHSRRPSTCWFHMEWLERRALLSAAADPSSGAAAVLYEAEQATLNGPAVSRAHGGFTGSGFADYQNASQDSIAWAVDLVESGYYELTFRYANGSAGNRPLEVRPNVWWEAPILPFAPTGAWDTWGTVTATVRFSAGVNTVHLTAIGSNGPNVDSLSVRPAAAQTLQAEAASASGPVVRHALAGFTGAGYQDFQHASGDWVDWAVTVPGAGSYGLDFRYANGAGADRPLELRVNGAVARTRLSFAPTGSWSTWKMTKAVVNLAAGLNRVRLTSVGANGPNVDALVVAAPGGTTDAIRLVGDVLTIEGGAGDDVIILAENGGRLTATRGGESRVFSADAAARAELYGRAGDDLISVGSTVPVVVIADGGEGNDYVAGRGPTSSPAALATTSCRGRTGKTG